MEKVFATAINCIDGRVQRPVMEFAMREFGVDYVDLITEPGPDKVLSEKKEPDIIESIRKRTMFSIERHQSKIVMVVAHYDCAANPVEKEEHYQQIEEAVRNIKDWNLGVDVYGLWVDKNWKAVLI